jgi:hypothetical protein
MWPRNDGEPQCCTMSDWTTQERYNACFQLALARGLTVTVGDYRNLNSFIYQCLAGKIPR